MEKNPRPRNITAQALACKIFTQKIVRPKKGKGSYDRKNNRHV